MFTFYLLNTARALRIIITNIVLVIMLSLSSLLMCAPVNCPVDNIKLSVVVANLAVAEQIGELLVHCRYGVEPVLANGNCASASDCDEKHQVNPHGCPVTMRASLIQYGPILALFLVFQLL